jgi:esterase/lipase superfamily enzyme
MKRTQVLAVLMLVAWLFCSQSAPAAVNDGDAKSTLQSRVVQSPIVAPATTAQSQPAADAKAGKTLDLAAGTVPKYIRIPVYYLTDRNQLEKTKNGVVDFGCERKYRGVCKHELFMGMAYCCIRNTENKTFSPSMEQQGWELTKRNSEGPDGTTLIKADTYKDVQNQFYDDVYKSAVGTPDHEAFVFVPGYMSTFESGMRSAARLSYYGERPVILYSWASKGRFSEYFADEATVEWSQEHFNEFLSHVSQFAERTPPVYSRLYAHSMGGRLVLRATPVIKKNHSLREVSVVCPDVDDGLVKHYAAKYFDGNGDMLVRLYISKRDFMLRLSQFVHGGYSQLGEDHQPLDSLLPKTANKFVPTAAADAAEIPCAEELRRKLLTIDFTAVDIGTLGHRIPVELLTGLSQTGTPPAPLKLRLTTPKGQLISDDAAASANDGLVKVIKPGWKGTPVIGALVRYRPRLRLLMTKDWSLK